ncbi:hypothetical protein AHAS_Ahas16G0188300 [Arachis hypogaea]
MNATLHGSRKKTWCTEENSICQPPEWKIHEDQLEGGCENKIWDPGSKHEDQLWELISWVELHLNLVKMVGISVNHLRSKDPWRFKDEYKHKPP